MSKNIDSVMTVLQSGQITQSHKVDEFEARLSATVFKTPYVVTVNSGTSALYLALKMLKDVVSFDPSTDVVLTPAMTCFATTSAICMAGYKIRWLDSSTKDANVDIEDVKSKLDANTKIVIVVHWGGNPVNLSSLKLLQRGHYIKYGYEFQILEDCAHAFGAYTSDGIPIGSSGNMCAFSFQAIKHLTTVDGGLLVVPTAELHERAKRLRWYGIDRTKRNASDPRLDPDIPEAGTKLHMNDVAASIGLANLDSALYNVIKCRNNTMKLNTLLFDGSIPNIKSMETGNGTAGWIYSLRVLNGHKASFMNYMNAHGVACSQVHTRNDKNTCVSSMKYANELQGVSTLEEEMLCIPCGWWLTNDDIDYIVRMVRRAVLSSATETPQ